ncbi:family transcriptional regulator [Bacillus safensis FO-36b] [Bacillus safensis subsp. safensis]
MAAKMVPRGAYQERDVLEHFEVTEVLKKPNGCVVLLFQKCYQIEETAGIVYFLVLCRSIFQRSGFHLIQYEH